MATATGHLGEGVAAMRDVCPLAQGAVFAIAVSANLQT